MVRDNNITPIALHSFFSLYCSFSSLLEVLYPAIRKLPFPKSKVIDNIANIPTIIQPINFLPQLLFLEVE